MAERPSGRLARTESPAAPGPDERLGALVVEDDPATARAIVASFELQGFDTRHAPTLDAARRELAARPPTIASLDLVLPDGSGFELVPELGAAGVRCVIVVSGERSRDVVLESLGAEVFRHLVKPLRLSALFGAIVDAKALLAEDAEPASR